MKQYLIISCLLLSLLGCKKSANEDLKIDSLNKYGDEFYYGEKVQLWTRVLGLEKGTSYSWSCTGGSFYNEKTNNLFENVWIAPAEAGDYVVTATAKNGKDKSSKSTAMKVKWYFFDEFQTQVAEHGWAIQNSKTQLFYDVDPAKSLVELRPTGTSVARLKKSLTAYPCKIPFSIKTTLGWREYFLASNAIQFSMFFKQPIANANRPYIREIRFQIYPTKTGSTTNYWLRYESYTPSTNTSVWSADATVLPAPKPFIIPSLGRNNNFQLAANTQISLSFSVDNTNEFYMYANGNLWLQSSAFKEWLAYHKNLYPDFDDPILEEIQIWGPGKPSGGNESVVLINNVFIATDGTILK